MNKEQIEYIILGLLHEAICQTTDRATKPLGSGALGLLGARMSEIERTGVVESWWIVNGNEFVGGTD